MQKIIYNGPQSSSKTIPTQFSSIIFTQGNCYDTLRFVGIWITMAISLPSFVTPYSKRKANGGTLYQEVKTDTSGDTSSHFG